MKRLLLGVAAAAMTFTGFAASAQTYRGYDGYRSHDRSYDRGYEQHRDWDRDRDHDRGERHSHWREGQYYSGYARRDRMISNWRAYNLPAPRSGYGYYRDDNGDVVMAALASGLIGLVLGNALSDQGGYGYSQPTYQQPYGYSGYSGYGYQQPYGYPQSYSYPQSYGYQPYGY